MHGGLRVCNVLVECTSVRCIENRRRIQLVCKQVLHRCQIKKVIKSDIKF